MTWLVEDWKQFMRWWSVRFAALVVMAPLLYQQFAQLQQYVPPTVFNYGMSFLGVLVIFGRLKAQADT